jgi:hypothetical protein
MVQGIGLYWWKKVYVTNEIVSSISMKEMARMLVPSLEEMDYKELRFA